MKVHITAPERTGLLGQESRIRKCAETVAYWGQFLPASSQNPGDGIASLVLPHLVDITEEQAKRFFPPTILVSGGVFRAHLHAVPLQAVILGGAQAGEQVVDAEDRKGGHVERQETFLSEAESFHDCAAVGPKNGLGSLHSSWPSISLYLPLVSIKTKAGTVSVSNQPGTP